MAAAAEKICKFKNLIRPRSVWPDEFNSLEDVQLVLGVAGWKRLAEMIGCPYCLGFYLSLGGSLSTGLWLKMAGSEIAVMWGFVSFVMIFVYKLFKRWD